MGSESPNAVLYDSAGNALAVTPGSAIPAGNSALLLAGTDGTNARTISVDTSGRTVFVGAGTAGTPAGGVITIQGVSGGVSLPVSVTTSASDVSATGALGALNAAVSVTHPGLATVGFQLAAGTLIGTIIPEVSYDGGSTWNATYFDTLAGSIVSSFVFASSNTATAAAIVTSGGAGQTRVRVSAYTSGTANITVRASDINDPSVLSGGATGGTLPPVANQVGGSVTTSSPTYITGTFNALSLTTAGALRVDGSAVTQPVSGTVTANQGTSPFNIVGNAANGAVPSGAPVLVAGWDGTDVRTLSTDTSGHITPATAIDKNGTGILAALNATVVATTNGCSTIAFDLIGTYVGTVVFEGQTGDGTWYDTVCWLPSLNSETLLVQNLATVCIVPCGGFTQVRARMYAYTSGSITVTYNASTGTNTVLAAVQGATANGGASIGNPVLIGGEDTGGIARTLLTDTTGSLQISENAPLTATSYPDPGNYVTTSTSSLSLDSYGNLMTRGPVFTDEGSLRDDFTGTSLTTAITGNLTFTNGSVTVTGTNLQTQIKQGQYIKKTADPESDYVQVQSVDSATSLTLQSAYVGTSGAAASVVTTWATTTGTGGSIAVASSVMTIASGTTASSLTQIYQAGDYLPYTTQFYVSVSQRIANQTFYIGFQQNPGATPGAQATVQFTGTTNTQCTFVTAFSSQATDQSSQTVSLPNGGITSAYHLYSIALSANQATLSIDGVVVATSNVHMPSPYQVLNVVCGSLNGGTAPASTTSFNVDLVYFANYDRVQVDDDFQGEPLPAQIQSISPNISLSGRIPTDNGTSDVFWQAVIAQRLPQIQVPFNIETPATLVTVTTSGTGATALGTGLGTFSTGTGTTSESKGVTNTTVFYSPHHEIYGAMTASFTTPTSAASYQRIGLYNTTDGFSFGYNGTTFGLWLRYNSVDTFIAQTNWNVDTCMGNASSRFTNQNLPATLVPTNINLYRIRFGWLGIAPIVFEILSPDGNFVIVHTARFPNSQTTVSVTNPNMPITLDVNKTAADATNLIVNTGCWVAGITAGTTPDFSGVNSIAALNAAITIPTTGVGGLSWNITGTWSGTISFQFSSDGINWFNDSVFDDNTSTFMGSVVANGNFETNVGSYKQYRFIATAWTSGTAIISYNTSVGSTIITTQTLITDGSNDGPVAVKPASTSVTATDASLAVALSPNTPFGVVDRSAMTAGSQIGIPHIGQSNGVGRIQTLNRLGYTIPGYQTMLAVDVVEGTTINSWLWAQTTGTMAIAQTTGVLTLNSAAITTANTYAILSSNKQFPQMNQAPVACLFKALITQTTNAVNEIGFGTPTTNTATVSNGAFFRISATGLIHTVISFNGTETVSASLGSIVTTSYYNFIVVIEDNGVRFIMEDESGIPIVDTSVPYALTVGQLSSVSHLPAFARVYVTATTAGAAPQTKIAAFQAWQFGINTTRPWSDQMGSSGRWANVNPTTFAQTLQLAAGAAPTTVTPNSTGSTLYTTLGGEYSINITASSENLLGVFGFQVPSPYALAITDLQFQNPFLTTGLGATANYQEWCLMVASSSNPSTATGYRVPLGAYTAAASATAGTVYNGQPIIKNFTTPIIVLPGQYLLVLVKQISGSAAGVARGAIFINGYFE